MIKLITSLFLMTSVFQVTFAKEDVSLFNKGSYKVIAKVYKKSKSEAFLKVFKNTTSEVDIKINNNADLLDRFPKDYRGSFCLIIKEECNWKCEAKLVNFIKGVKPWVKDSIKNSITKVDKCEGS